MSSDMEGRAQDAIEGGHQTYIQMYEEIELLTKQRDALLAALEWAAERIEPASTKEYETENDCHCPVCAAIAAVKDKSNG